MSEEEKHSPEPWVIGCWEEVKVGRKLYREFHTNPTDVHSILEVWSGVKPGTRVHCSEKTPGETVIYWSDDWSGGGLLMGDEDIRRAVACVNACVGYDTVELELWGEKKPKQPDERFLELCRGAYRAMCSQEKHLDPENSGQTGHSQRATESLVSAFRLIGATL